MLYEEEKVAHIGLDDIDTPFGGCTTELAARLVLKWCRRGIELVDLPGLIRLSPTVPWKTRGNGALVIRVRAESWEEAQSLYMEAVEEAHRYVERHRHPESHPSVAMVYGKIPYSLRVLAERAVWSVLPLETLMRHIGGGGAKTMYTSIEEGKKRGLVGAFSAIGVTLLHTDYTYELTTYRRPENIGKPRRISYESVARYDAVVGDKGFLNIDPETRSVLIAPRRSPDPVLYGVRGEDPLALMKALEIIDAGEEPAMYMVYRTNQATDMHLRRIHSLGEAYPYTGVIVDAVVSSPPRRIRGGHVIMRVSDGGHSMDIAAYEPTASLRDMVEKLWVGDRIRIYGTVRPPGPRHPATINIEKIRILGLAEKVRYEAPRCPRCGHRMKSMGRNKGYRCPRCGYRDPRARKIPVVVPRPRLPEWLVPPPRAYKHLMKPLSRMGKEKKRPPEPSLIKKTLSIICRQVLSV